MTDDAPEKTDPVAELHAKWRGAARETYEHLMDTEREITPEAAASITCTLHIAARDTAHPKASYRSRGGGGGSGGSGEKTYRGGKWEDPATEGQLFKLNGQKNAISAHLFQTDEKVKGDRVGARELQAKAWASWWPEKFEGEMPDNPKDWTKGQASFYINENPRRFKDVFQKKGGK